jgi:hypothetical protein
MTRVAVNDPTAALACDGAATRNCPRDELQRAAVAASSKGLLGAAKWARRLRPRDALRGHREANGLAMGRGLKVAGHVGVSLNETAHSKRPFVLPIEGTGAEHKTGR